MIERTMTPDELPDWFTELLILRATDGLDSAQQEQFEQFVDEHPDRNQVESEIEKFDLTVAAVDLSFQSVESDADPLPAGLREKLLAGANRYWDEERSLDVPASKPKTLVEPKSKSGFSTREAMAWLTAAAAVVLLMTGLNPFAPSIEPPDEIAKTLSIGERYDQFVSNSLDEGVTEADWKPQVSPFVEKGKVVWSDVLQKGFMVFEGLKANDPLNSQYQLWIFDKNRNSDYPVDGGVFDVASTGKTIVEIDAKIPVSQATMFAVTEEIPGGVVVSSRERLPLLAEVVATSP
jgi:hypothetical protein